MPAFASCDSTPHAANALKILPPKASPRAGGSLSAGSWLGFQRRTPDSGTSWHRAVGPGSGYGARPGDGAIVRALRETCILYPRWFRWFTSGREASRRTRPQGAPGALRNHVGGTGSLVEPVHGIIGSFPFFMRTGHLLVQNGLGKAGAREKPGGLRKKKTCNLPNYRARTRLCHRRHEAKLPKGVRGGEPKVKV